jgi:hypothetical protein
MRMMRGRVNDERGATIVIVGLVMVAVLGMLALVTDVGGLVSMKRRVVNATDSAALAAAQSFARDQGGRCGSSGGDSTALNTATTFAQDNVGTATNVDFSPDCNHSSVSVEYQAPVQFFFAGVIGGGNGSQVPAESTAIWGPVGKARPAPIMVFQSQLAACGIPDTVPPQGQTIPCDLTYNADQQLGPPFWGELDLSQWNDGSVGSCHVDANELMQEIAQGGWPTELAINSGGVPTPDCADNGRSTSVFHALDGQTLTFPVVADTPISDLGGSGGALMNVIGFVKVTVDSVENPSTIVMHIEWAGPSSQPGVPVVGAPDFGFRAVRLVG